MARRGAARLLRPDARRGGRPLNLKPLASRPLSEILRDPELNAYFDECPIQQAVEIIGGRWTLLIVRELLDGPRRFSALRQALAPVSAKMLAERLRALEEAGIVSRAPAAYELTEAGRDLEPVLRAVFVFGARRQLRAAAAR